MDEETMKAMRRVSLALVWALLLTTTSAKTLHTSTVPHATTKPKPDQPDIAAVFTPYYLTPGGGEKYLLSTVRAMQTLGFYVDILVQPDNVCQAQQCVMEVATNLRVTLDPRMFSVHVVHREAFKIYAGPYTLFFALGNEKYPPVKGIGKVNLFMCQFPFDLANAVPQGVATDIYPTYDVVILNSNYSLRWYYTFSIAMFHEVQGSNQLFTRMHVLHPPVTLLTAAADDPARNSRKKNIVMVGRFFAGRQSKGHPQAVRIFAELYTTLPQDTNLIMVGNPMPGNSAYLDDLKNLITNFGLTSRVEIVLAAPSEQVVRILQSGLVQWHLTGLGVRDDPASLEHFGISIVEGMSTGCIPIAYTGGAADTIQHGHDGFMANSAERIVQYTQQIFAMSAGEQRAMQSRCIHKARKFEYEQFEAKFHDLVNTTTMIKPDPPMARAMVAALRQ